jgi:PAS domain S-box-containing protein
MTSKKKPSSGVKTLRYRAENVLKATNTQVKKMSLPEIQHLVHELQVHQIELEMQNEELMQAQLDLQQARDRYADLYDFAPVGFLTLNSRGQILEANLPACQLLGVERKTLLRQKLEKFVLATDQKILRQHLHHVEQGHIKEISDVIRLKHNASSYFVRLESLYEVLALPNLEARFRMAILDLTEQEKTKALQKEQEVWVRAMLDSAMDAIITVDDHQKIILFNASAVQMFGCTTKEALGQSLDRFIPQRFRKAHADHMKNFERGSSVKRRMGSLGEVTGLRANGEEFPLEASISKVRSEKGVLFTVILRDITDRRTMENTLGKEKEFIATVLDSVGALVLILDLDWRIVRCNQVCTDLTGRKMADIRGKFFLDLSVETEEETPKVKDILGAFKEKQSLISFENAWVGRDRQLHWIRWFNTVLTDKEGKAINVIATGVDITARKRTELEMAHLAKHNELILNSAWEGIYGLDHKGKVTFFNRSAEQLTGWKGSDLQGQVLHNLLHHSKQDGTPYPWKNCPVYVSLRQGKIQSVDTEVLWRKDGTCFEVEYTSMPFHNNNNNNNNKIEGAVVTFRDITARRESEKALRESEERFQAFMNYTPTVAFLKDDKGRYVYVNRQFQEKLHFSLADCLGKTDPELFPPEIASIFIEHDQKVLKTKKVLEVEESTLDETGSVCHWWVMKFLIPRQGGPGWLGGVALDITDRKKDHEVLQQREAELQGSKKILQALGGRLLSAQEDERRRISRELHDDMNQRLAVLAFNIQSVQKGLDLSDLMYQNLQNLYDGVSSISDDVRRLAYQLHPSILDDLGLNVALRSFVSDFTKWGGIPVEYSSTDVPVSLPPEISSCLYRVAQESLRNAARHAECSKIEVRLLGVDGGLRLSILDNGKGFEVKKGRPGVHGLGLIGMEERVRVVEGTYEVKSAPGQGTKITVWVPISP